jgi:hypothetical protein
MTPDRISQILEGAKLASPEVDSGLFIMTLAASLFAALATCGYYRFFYERRGTGSQIHRAFPMLALSITTLFIGIQLSIPLSLGLLGSLSIIRFRVPVKEPEEVGFVMLVVASSIAAATFQFRFLIHLHAIALVTLVAVRRVRSWRVFGRDGVLMLHVAEADAREHRQAIEALLDCGFRRHVLESASVSDGTTRYQYVFSGLQRDIPDLRARLASVCPVQSLNVFLDRPGGVR